MNPTDLCCRREDSNNLGAGKGSMAAAAEWKPELERWGMDELEPFSANELRFFLQHTLRPMASVVEDQADSLHQGFSVIKTREGSVVQFQQWE